MGSTRAALEAMLQAKAAALVARSGEAMAALLDDSFVYVNATGRVVDKAGYLAAFSGDGPLRFISQRIDRLEVIDHGDMAIATMVLHDAFDTPDGHFEGSMRSMAVFRRTAQGWRWSAGQTMRLPEAT